MKLKNIILLCLAVLLHILGLLAVSSIQKKAFPKYSPIIYTCIKLLLRWALLLIPLAFMRLEHMHFRNIGISAQSIGKQIAIGLLIGIIWAGLIVGVTMLLGFREQLGTAPPSAGWYYAFYLFYAIFGVAALEEIFFRGYIFSKLQEINSAKYFAIVISSLLFGICHLFGNGKIVDSIIQALLAAATGIIYCLLRDKIENCTLISLIFLHGTYDFMIIFLPHLLQRSTVKS